MAVFSIYLFYGWVIIIHSIFIGISAFAIWGKVLEGMIFWKTLILLMIPIVFLEFYWIPYAHYLGLSLHTQQEEILTFFQIAETTNIRDHFTLRWYHPIVFISGSLLAYATGRWTYFKNH